ncbi:MAG: winged helix-turn-helix transcriptional regulator [Sphingomonadales bacterium]|nr:winged helix-turn-helix transcriptional regulator [Sphingomonadales bacterium]
MQTYLTRNESSFPQRTVAIVSLNDGEKQILEHIAGRAGCSAVNRPDIAQFGPEASQSSSFDLLIADITSISDRPSREISNISAYLTSSGGEALIWTDMDNLDEAYAHMPISQCHFLIKGADLEALLIMSGAIRRGKKMENLHDNSRDTSIGALHKISDELADFARTLAKLADQDDIKSNHQLAEKPVSFRPAPSSILQPFVETKRAAIVDQASMISAASVREIIKQRRRRDSFFDTELFADPAWDILLDLLVARLEEKSVSVSSLCIAAAVPATTALRWITGMTESGLLVRRMDPKDARRVFIDLSDESAAKLEKYFCELYSSRVSVI